MIEETIIQAAREWLKTAATLSDAQVTVAADKKTKRPAAYLDVSIPTPLLGLGQDYARNGEDAGNPTVTPVGERTALVQLDGYGPVTGEWLNTAILSLVLEDIQDLNRAAGFTFVVTSPVIRLDELVDTGYEARYTLEVEARFRISGTAVTQVEATQVVLDATLEKYEGDPNALTFQVNETI